MMFCLIQHYLKEEMGNFSSKTTGFSTKEPEKTRPLGHKTLDLKDSNVK